MNESELRCFICRFVVEADDIAERSASGRVLCLHCWNAATKQEKPMPKALDSELHRTAGPDK